VLDGVGCQSHASAALPSGKTQYSLYSRLGEPQVQPGPTGRDAYEEATNGPLVALRAVLLRDMSELRCGFVCNNRCRKN
jgi:hypothetical protein